MARLYVEGVFVAEINGYTVVDRYHNHPQHSDGHWKNGAKNVCIVHPDGESALVTTVQWGNGLPEGPTGWTLQRVRICDEAVPSTVKLAELLLK